ncbi:substrate-binding periplasmic protein [Vibrio ostreicida]|uniref:Transporter substrate-binding domain-containing protein n=1 Tax=Vibrio ostreicida TaxID=526588 RepID=A0ABT8BQ33_9VIBR|nr:transporter substrate-binding domain-containing protein [Vibrio ostreicida]MDN3608922.1 transporter substrate-binding domain-containing protein [Vibrio ostreicida]NPD09956.1 amino acid ABC transporter substrate-binding protein [Vibrio ostreicida]
MIKRLPCGFLLFCTLYFSSGVSASTVVAAIGDYPPYTSTEDSQARFAEELVIASYRAVGYQVTLKRVPWKRAFEEVKVGKVDITFPWIKTPSRENDFLFSEALLTTQEIFLYHKDSHFSWSKLDDLKRFKVGATLGYAHVELMMSQGITPNVGKTDAFNIERLYKKRIDAFPIGEKVGEYLLSKSPNEVREAITAHSKPLFKNLNYIMASKVTSQRSKTLLEKFNQGFEAIKQDGTFDKIVEKYGF